MTKSTAGGVAEKAAGNTGRPGLLHRALETYVLFPLFAALILILIWLASFRMIGLEGETVERGTADSARELVEIYDAQMIRNLGTVDQTLRTIAYAYELQTADLSLSELKEKGLLPSTLVFTVRIASASGEVMASTKPEQSASIALQPFFMAHEAQRTAFPTVSMITLASGEQRLQFSRRLEALDGSFSGVAMVSVEPGYFVSGYDQARLGKMGVLGLVKDDGRFLIKRTGDQISSGQIVDAASMAAGTETDSGNSALLVNGWDRVKRYTNARRLYGFPLTVIVGLSQAEQLEAFQRQKRNYLWAAAAASALLLAIAAMLTRLSWQLAKNRARTRKAQETYYAASEASLDAVFVLRSIRNAEESIVDFLLDNANTRAAAMFGKTKDALLGRKLCSVLPQCRDNGILAELSYVARTGKLHEQEWKNDLAAVDATWLYRQVARVEDGVVVIMRDISERKEMEERISHMAHHDALTGLPNRSLLGDRIKQAILQAQRNDQSAAVVFLDLDNFKLVNDTLGHKAGDELLVAVANRMAQVVRKTDTVVRLGGDEFVIVLIGQSNSAESIATAMQKVRKAIAQPIYIAGQTLEITSSMGLAMYPNDGHDSDTLLMNADAAMYQAKALGRNNYQFYTREMNTLVHEKFSLQEGLRDAIGRNEFFLAYQPQVDLRTGLMVGVEALIRWQHPDKGLIAPLSFIGLAEETGLIVPIGEWVLDCACKQNKAWQVAGMPPVVISVNVSARQFKDKNLLRQVKTALHASDLEPRYLGLEITENLIMQDVQQAVSIMKELQAMGVQLSIDDFGTGYSSLGALKNFPLLRLKLDRSFVSGLPHDENHRSIARAVIALGRTLDLKVLAEGVETAGQLSFLQENDCDEMQGYYFSEAVSATEIASIFNHPHQLPVA